MQLTISTPTRHETLEVNWMEMHTSVGNFVVQSGHAPMLLVLLKKEPFIVELLTGVQQKFILVAGGVIHIDRHNALLVADEVV